MIYTVRVIYWRPWLGSGRPATASAAVAAGLHGRTRRQVRVRAALGTGTAANGCVCVHKAKAMRNGVSAMLYRAAGTRPQWSSGGGAPAAAFRPPGLSTGHYFKRSRKDRVGESSPRARVGRRRCATAPASRSGGSITTELVEVTLPGVLGTPGSTGQCVVVLRGRQRGQCGRSDTGGEQLRRCSLLTCGWTGRNSGDGEVRGRGRRPRGDAWAHGAAAAQLWWG